MTFKPKIWFPIAAMLTAVNVSAVYMAAQATEPVHAVVHGALGVLFAVWADRLRRRRASAAAATREVAGQGLQGLEMEMDEMRRELSEAQERLDFAERLLSQQPRAVKES